MVKIILNAKLGNQATGERLAISGIYQKQNDLNANYKLLDLDILFQNIPHVYTYHICIYSVTINQMTTHRMLKLLSEVENHSWIY